MKVGKRTGRMGNERKEIEEQGKRGRGRDEEETGARV